LGPQGDDERSSTPPLKEGSASKHVVPSWAGPAANDLSLLVIKDGVEVQTLPINDRSFYVIGEWVRAMQGWFANSSVIVEPWPS
jgi:hypothetical protein